MKVKRAPIDYPHWSAVADLIRNSFEYMTSLLGHPAEAMSVTADRLAKAAAAGVVLVVEEGGKPVACLFTRPSRDVADALYLGWLAVAPAQRGRGLAQALVTSAAKEARARDLAALTLDTGCELVRLHSLFQQMGFRQHSDDGTVVRFCRPVGDAD